MEIWKQILLFLAIGIFCLAGLGLIIYLFATGAWFAAVLEIFVVAMGVPFAWELYRKVTGR